MINSPIFITGFESSGTTLLRRICSMHPALEKDIIHEQRKLLQYRSAKHAELNYFDEYSSIKSGEKIPYYTNIAFIMEYIDKFIEFWPDCLIFHIVRNPEECARSSNRRFNRDFDVSKNFCKSGQYKINEYLERIKCNAFEVDYNDLVKEPLAVVTGIYGIMGEIPPKGYIKKVISTREPWYNGEKRNCGLRYKKKVEL